MHNPKPKSKSTACKGSRAFDRAIDADRAWFRDNVTKTRRRRNVNGRELPRHLRGLGIVAVVIELASPTHFIRTFMDREGRPVAGGIDEFDAPVVPGAPSHPIWFTPGGRPAIDRADTTDCDRGYFEKNPDAVEYVRDAQPAELQAAQEQTPHERLLRGRVRVRQLAPNVRMRELVSVEVTRKDDER